MQRCKFKPLRIIVHGLNLIMGLLGMLALGDRSAYAGFLSVGDHVIVVQHADRERAAIVHVPVRAPERRDIPVIINFHGGGGHGSNEQEYSLMDRLADRQLFLAVYPNGTGRFSKRLLTWNAGSCCGYAAIHQIDDIGFVRVLIDEIAEVMPIDRRRIYATGLSNGAMMAHRLAAEAGDLIAAIAPIAGGMVLPVIKSQRAIPVMHIHSLNDPRALYGGGLGSAISFYKQPRVSSQYRSDDLALGEAQRLFGRARDRSTARKQGTAPERNALRLSWLPRRFRSRALEA